MTDRYNTITVVLEADMRDDDAEGLLEAIRRMRGVLTVKGDVADPTAFMAEERARRELGRGLWNLLYPDQKKEPRR